MSAFGGINLQFNIGRHHAQVPSLRQAVEVTSHVSVQLYGLKLKWVFRPDHLLMYRYPMYTITAWRTLVFPFCGLESGVPTESKYRVCYANLPVSTPADT